MKSSTKTYPRIYIKDLTENHACLLQKRPGAEEYLSLKEVKEIEELGAWAREYEDIIEDALMWAWDVLPRHRISKYERALDAYRKVKK